MDRDRLRQIIAEELARALAEEGSGISSPANPPKSESRAYRASPHSRLGLVCFSGERAPSASLWSSLASAREAGWTLEALTSFSFRSVAVKENPGALSGLVSLKNPNDEGAVAQRIAEASLVIFPDISTNSLNKAALGIADSVPTRAVAQALTTHACLFLETGSTESAVVGLSRLETLRRLERRGAWIAGAQDFLEQLRRAARPLLTGSFPSMSGAPSSGRSPAGRVVVTAEDVVESARRGRARVVLPSGAIVTDRAREEARRRGIKLVNDEAEP